jgi:hypothetical protein
VINADDREAHKEGSESCDETVEHMCMRMLPAFSQLREISEYSFRRDNKPISNFSGCSEMQRQ